MTADWRNITVPEMRQEWTWRSPALNRDMSVCRWGYFGKPVLVFSTAGGDFLEVERFMLIKSIRPLIEAGKIKVYGCGTVANDGWLDSDATPGHRAWLQARFDQYISEEVLPFIKRESGDTDEPFAAVGASLGAYNAVNTASKHPQWFDLVIAMSGTYEFKRWMNGHFDDNYYFNMPLHFLPKLGEGPLLERLRKCRFVLATGQGRAEAPHESVWIAKILEAKGVPHNLEVWGPDIHHDWPTWRAMLPMFLSRLV